MFGPREIHYKEVNAKWIQSSELPDLSHMSSWTWEAAGFTFVILHSSSSYADWISHLSLNPQQPTQWRVSNIQRSSLRRLFGISCQDVYGKILNQIKAWQIRQSCLYKGEKCSYEVRNITVTSGLNTCVWSMPRGLFFQVTPFLSPNLHFWSEWNTPLAHQNEVCLNMRTKVHSFGVKVE